MIRDQRGQLTVDFIFAIVLVIGFTAMLFVISFSLTVASITQYITFAAARNYVVAHLDEPTQIARGQAKYQELISNKTFKPLYAAGWFKVSKQAFVGDQTTQTPGYDQATQGVNEFWGVSTTFVATILDFHIPFFGSSNPDGNGDGSGFTTMIGSYLGREPSADECLKFTAQRWTAIRNLSVQAGTAYSQGTSTQGYFPIADDGC
jgi:hypothetical protein